MEQNNTKNSWVVFIGFVLALVGIYGCARTIINMIAFEKYPQEGVYPALPFFQPAYPTYFGREGDCLANYGINYPMYDASGKPVKQTEEEKAEQKKQQEIQKQNCLDGVKESRDKAKVNDISQSLLALFIGAGILGSKKILKRNQA